MLSIVMAWVLWRFVERPARGAIRAWYRRHECALSPGQWRAVSGLVLAVLVAILAATIVSLRSG
jgi:peptidoglycan/LPS O-acetylase OafA/YrhL